MISCAIEWLRGHGQHSPGGPQSRGSCDGLSSQGGAETRPREAAEADWPRPRLPLLWERGPLSLEAGQVRCWPGADPPHKQRLPLEWLSVIQGDMGVKQNKVSLLYSLSGANWSCGLLSSWRKSPAWLHRHLLAGQLPQCDHQWPAQGRLQPRASQPLLRGEHPSCEPGSGRRKQVPGKTLWELGGLPGGSVLRQPDCCYGRVAGAKVGGLF